MISFKHPSKARRYREGRGAREERSRQEDRRGDRKGKKEGEICVFSHLGFLDERCVCVFGCVSFALCVYVCV